MAPETATVELTFSPLPAHVRTARLIATAVARRGGVEETLLDEVRLAVGEACSRAVEAHRQQCPEEPVRVELRDGAERFEVVVTDCVPDDDPTGGGGTEPVDLAELNGELNLGFAVIAGLADDVDIASTPAGVEITMSWPVKKD
ncbi:ATP-binding protein [Actinoallomurus purpureus]|uniref:ATP-binding protein n=1 Tax=Actinoallomurus purpureus TaxID=478114 RepID=UPI002092C7A2|nr:ATP-binding protein [Actinoallomurus purpureus]MCO6007117.1 ATP-binding protein [Actinoallomurus purpureus]